MGSRSNARALDRGEANVLPILQLRDCPQTAIKLHPVNCNTQSTEADATEYSGDLSSVATVNASRLGPVSCPKECDDRNNYINARHSRHSVAIDRYQSCLL